MSKSTFLPFSANHIQQKIKIAFGFCFMCCCTISCLDSYEQNHEIWKEKRFLELKEPFGWPSVTGLFPFRNSMAYFGSAETNDFVIPNGPSSFGFLTKTDTGVVMTAYTSVKAKIDGKEVKKTKLRTDTHPDGPSYGTYKSIQWYLIQRNEEYFLRVKDTLSEYRSALQSIPYFPFDKNFVVEAYVELSQSSDSTITYKNILGMNITREIAAVINFEWNGASYQLTAVENDAETYMIMVHDETTGISTYGGGRYMYPDKADAHGKVVLDFNKLINPPCVFTPYATCPLPPKSNHLPFEINAGEKVMHLY